MISEGSTKNSQHFDFENLPKEGMCSLILHKNKILFFNTSNNYPKICYEMVDGGWKKHSTLYRDRGPYTKSAVTTSHGTFIFGGGFYTKYTYEYLLNGSSEWELGKTKIPGGFRQGCAIALKSKPEVWLIGGYDNNTRILSFNLQTHSFTILPTKLLVGRIRFQCSYIPNTKKVIVTGGHI